MSLSTFASVMKNYLRLRPTYGGTAISISFIRVTAEKSRQDYPKPGFEPDSAASGSDTYQLGFADDILISNWQFHTFQNMNTFS